MKKIITGILIILGLTGISHGMDPLSPLSLYATKTLLQNTVGTFETTSGMNRALSTFETSANINIRLSTFETTAALLNRGYITSQPGLSTFETTAAMNSVLSTFETISSVNGRLSTFETVAAHNASTKEVVMKVIADDTALTAGAGKMYFTVTEGLHGKTLKTIKTHIYTTSSSGTPEVTVKNYTTGDYLLGTPSKIDVGTYDSSVSVTPEVVWSPASIAVAAQVLGVDVTAAGTGAAGLEIRLKYQ